MKKLITFLSLSLFIFSCKPEPAKKATDAELIKECYSKYQEGLLQGKGTNVMGQVSKVSLDYYSEILRYAKGADSTAIVQSALTEKFTILLARQKIDSEMLVNMSDESFFIYVVEQGMIGKSSVDGLELGDVFVDGNTAKGAIIIKGVPQKYQFNFMKEGEDWKIDLINLMTISSDGLRAQISESPISEDEYILKTVEIATRKKRKEDLWRPRK